HVNAESNQRLMRGGCSFCLWIMARIEKVNGQNFSENQSRHRHRGLPRIRGSIALVPSMTILFVRPIIRLISLTPPPSQAETS
ncbi:MAG: hypothetical protein NXI22_20525, partial [bacterium]|nr:hypothetical protein [bacterium]